MGYETDIYTIRKVAHEAKKNGISIRKTLKEYGVPKTVFYDGCKRARLRPWRPKTKKGTVLIKKQIMYPSKIPEPIKKDAKTRSSKTDPTKEKKKRYPVSDSDEPLTVVHNKKETQDKLPSGVLTNLEERLYNAKTGNKKCRPSRN